MLDIDIYTEIWYIVRIMNTDDEKLFKSLGDRLKAAREKLGVTQSEIAEKAGINTNYYARIERGEENPSFSKLQKIMKVLKIKSLDIL